MTSLGGNIDVLRKNLATATKYTQDAKAEVDTLVNQAKNAVSNYKVYVTLAVNIANDVEKSNCTSGSSEEVQEVVQVVSNKIDNSAEYYLQNFFDILNELIGIKTTIASQSLSSITATLNSCVDDKSLRLDVISKCIQWNAAAYKEVITATAVKIAAAYNKALFLKKTTGLKVLKNNIDTSVSLSSNDIKNYAEEILQCSGMSASSILNTAGEKFDALNESANAAVLIAIVDLKELIKQTQNRINVSFNGAEPQLKTLVADIETAINLIIKYKPELAADLNIYRGRAQDIVSSGLTQLNLVLSKIIAGLDKINVDLDGIFVDFQAKIEQNKVALQACLPAKIEDRLTWTKAIVQCTNNQLNITADIGNKAKLQISSEKDKYTAFDLQSSVNLDFNVEFSNVKPKVEQVIDEMLVKSGLAEQILLAEAQDKLALSTKNSSNLLKIEIDTLRNSIAATANGLSIEVKKANKYQIDIVKMVNQAISFAEKYAPEYVVNLTAQGNLAQELVSTFKSSAEPVLNQLQSISISAGNILIKLQESQEQVKLNVKSCLNNDMPNRFSSIDAIIICIATTKNTADSLYVSANQQLTFEIEKYHNIPDINDGYQINADLQVIMNDVENIVNKIILTKNLNLDQLVENAKLKIDNFNLSLGNSIQIGSQDLTNSIVNAQNGVKVKITNNEQLLSELVIYPIASSVRYSIDYAPDKAAELKTFYLQSNEMLNNWISKIKSDALPYTIQFKAILDKVSTLYPSVQVQLRTNKASLPSCVNETGDGRIGKIEAVVACLNKIVDASETVARNIQISLSNEKDLFTAIGNVNINVELDAVKDAVNLAILDVLRVAGLTSPILLDKTMNALIDIKNKFAIPIENSVNELKSAATNMQHQILREINNIDEYIIQVLNSIRDTIIFAEKYSPKNVAILKNYLNETENLVSKIKTDLKPVNPKLAAIVEAIIDISIELNAQIQESEMFAKNCTNNTNTNPLYKIQQIKLCLENSFNTSLVLAEQTRLVLSKEYEKYYTISNMASYVTENLSTNLSSIVKAVNDKVDEIIVEKKLAPADQVETNLRRLAAINQTASDLLSFGVDKLQEDINNKKEQLNSDLLQAELAFGSAIEPVSIAVNYGKKYAPEKSPELNALYVKSEELVVNELFKLKTSITPTTTELDDIYVDSGEIYTSLKYKIDLANKSISVCSSINEPNKLVRIESVKLCLSNHMNGAVTATEEAQTNLQKEVDRYNNVANTNLKVNLNPIKAEVKLIIDNVFTSAGLNDEDILKKALDVLVSINNTRGGTLQVGVGALTTASTQTQSQISQGIDSINKYLNNTVAIIKEAIDFANKYDPSKRSELDNYLNLVLEKANIAKSDFEALQPKLTSIQGNINVLVGGLLIQINSSSDNLNICLKINIVERVARAENVRQCTDRYLNLTIVEVNKLENVLSLELEKYNALANIPIGISNNLSIVFNNTINQVDKVIDDIILSAGLSPESQLNKGVISLTSIYVTGNPRIGSEDLQNAVIRYQSDIKAAIDYAEKTLNQVIGIDEVFNYAIQYAPNKTLELNALKADKDKIIQLVLNNLKNNQEPVIAKLNNILNTLETNFVRFQDDFKKIEIDIRTCVNISIEDDIDRSEAIDSCINNNINLGRNIVNVAQNVLSQQITAFNNIGAININIDLNKVNLDLKLLITKAFEVSGLVPEILLNKTLQDLSNYNQTVATSLQFGIANLSANIFQTQEELTTTLSGADKYLNDIIAKSALAIDFATKYAPGKIADFQGYVNDAQKIVIQTKIDIQPAKIQLQSIQNVINTVYVEFLARLNQTQGNILSCSVAQNTSSFDTLAEVISFQNCLNTNLDISFASGNVSKERLSEESKKFDLIDNITVTLNDKLINGFSVIDTSVVTVVDEVIVTYGLLPDSLKSKGLDKLAMVRVQVNGSLNAGFGDLENAVNQSLSQINTSIINGEKALNQSVKIIDNAVNYAIEYNPEKVSELEVFRGKANEIVNNIIQNIKTNILPIQTELISVLENNSNILINFQLKTNEIKQNIIVCANDSTENIYAKIENIQLCIQNNLNRLVEEANKAQQSVYDKYEKFKAIGNIVIDIDTTEASQRAAAVVVDVLATAGLTGPQLQQKSSQNITAINNTVTVKLLKDIKDLKNAVTLTQNQNNQIVRNSEQYLINTTKYIEEAREFLIRHSPDKVPELEALLNQAQQIVVKLKADLQPGDAQLLAILNTAGLIVGNFQLQVEGTKASLKSCSENSNSNQLDQVISIRNCLISYENTTNSAANNANGQLNNEIKKYFVVFDVASNATVNISNDFNTINVAVKAIVESVIAEGQLKPSILYSQTVSRLTNINSSYSNYIQSGIDNLKTNIINTNVNINTTIVNIEKKLNDAIKPIEIAIQELIKYAPEKSAEIITFKTRAYDIIANTLSNIQSNIQPSRILLQSIFDSLDGIYTSLQTQLAQSRVNIDFCYSNQKAKDIENVEYLEDCFIRELNISTDVVNKRQNDLVNAYNRYDGIGNITLAVNVDFGTINVNVVTTVDEIRIVSGLTPELLLNSTKIQLDILLANNGSLVKNGIISLLNTVASTQFQISAAAKNAELQMKQEVQPIESAINLAGKYAPDKIVLLNNFLNTAQELVITNINKINADVLPSQNALENITIELSKILNNYETQVAAIKDNLTICISIENPNSYDNIPVIQGCFRTYVEQTNIIIQHTQEALSILQDKYSRISNTAILAGIDLGEFPQLVENVVKDIFLNAGFTIPELPNKLLTGIKNEFDIKVADDKQRSKLLTEDIVVIAEKYIQNLNGTLDWSLEPIKNAITTIKYIYPNYNTSALNDQWKTLYDQLRNTIVTFIKNIEKNASDNNQLAINYNLNVEFQLLKENLDNCVSNYRIGNIPSISNCIDPIVREFNNYVFNALNQTKTIVDEIEQIKITTPKLVEEFINKTAERARENANTVAESGKTAAAIKPDEQIKKFLVDLDNLRKFGINILINEINALIKNVKTGNLSAFIDLNAKLDKSAEPWLYAINISLINNPEKALLLSEQLPFIKKIVEDAKLRVKNELAPFIIDAIALESSLKLYQTSLNTNLTKYNSQLILSRCSSYNYSVTLFSDCIQNVTADLNSYLSVVQPQLNTYLKSANNISTKANSAISLKITIEFNATQFLSINEGGKVIQTYNISNNHILSQSLQNFRSYNITPLQHNIRSIRSYAERIGVRTTDMLVFGNYTLRSATYVINDAIGSVIYILNWRKTFNEERDEGIRIATQAANKVLATLPNFAEDIIKLHATADRLNNSLEYEVSQLEPAQLMITCPMTLEYYEMYQCLLTRVELFGKFYGPALGETFKEADNCWQILSNDTIQLNRWRDDVMYPETSSIVHLMKPVAQKLFVNNNIRIDQLLGYALNIIRNKYNSFFPAIPNAILNLETIAKRLLEKNYTGRVDLTQPGNLLLKPVTDTISYFISANVQNLLNETDLNQPRILMDQLYYTLYNIFYANFSIQARIAINQSIFIRQEVEDTFNGLSYDFLFNNCYDPSQMYPMVEMVNCYNTRHAAFSIYLTNSLKNLTTTASTLFNFDLNEQKIVTDYVNLKLLPEFKQTCALVAIELYRKVGLQPPAEYLALVTKQQLCRVGFITDRFTCIITQ